MSRASKILESLKGKTRRFQEANGELTSDAIEDIKYRLQKLLDARLSFKGQTEYRGEDSYLVFFSSAELSEKEWTGVSVQVVYDDDYKKFAINDLNWVINGDTAGTVAKGFKSFLVRAD